jgi:TonB family protein
MTEEVLFYEVTRRLRPMKNKNVFIDGAPTVNYGRVVDMVDLAREAGAAKVGLAKMKDGGPLPANSVAPGAMPKSVMLGSPTAVGGITEKNADAAFKPYLGVLEKCYYPLLAQYRNLSGRMMFRFTVGPGGELMNHKISSSSMEPEVPELEACVEQILGQVKFEPLGEGKTAIVQYPVLFSPG